MSILLTAVLAIAPVDSYNLGNKYYQEGDYPAAIDAYNSTISEVKASAVFYNLGNSFFKNGQIGKAILNYRRARFLYPRDTDTRYNLEFTRSYRADKFIFNQGPFERFLDITLHWLSFVESFWLSIFSLILLTVSISLFIIHRRRSILYFSMITGSAFLFFIISFSVWQNEKSSKPVVVIVPEVSAYSGPGEEYKQIMLIHDGTEVLMKERRQKFALVQLPGGSGGWLPEEALEAVY
jgi:tetratricopeptide (TPR) repeat protein